MVISIAIEEKIDKKERPVKVTAAQAERLIQLLTSRRYKR